MSNERDPRTAPGGRPKADRPPTPEEEAAAERAAQHVDVDDVAEHFEEMNELGARVKGEGEVEPRD